jgi:[acyl-carrier-protein] S-malonyltransferase
MRLAILCSGQARQNCRMLDEILTAPDCADLCALASDILEQDVARWWHALDETTLFFNANAQFAIALYQIATWQRIAPLVSTPESQPVVVAGYSVGEVIAWHVAGALDAAATLRLIRTRAALMDQQVSATDAGRCMLLWRGRSTPAMRAARQKAMASHGLSPAIYRPNGEWVLGGPASAVSAFRNDPAVRDASLRCLSVFVPSHTGYLQAAVAPFRDAVSAEHPAAPRMPVLAGIDGRLLRQGTDAADALSAQLAQPVRWDWCEETLGSLGVDVGLELGPGSDLAKMLEESGEGIVARAVEEFGSPASMSDWLDRHR